MSDRRRQLTFPLDRPEVSRFDNFHIGRNREVVERLEALAGGRGRPGLWLWGPAGSGRSHLLQATCHAVASSGGQARYLPLATLPPDPVVLEGVRGDLVALDDVAAWLGDLALETALMGVYESQRELGGAVLLAAPVSAQQSHFALADLASRLRALVGFQVRLPDDDGLRLVLAHAARRLGLTLDASVLDYWLHRTSRSLPSLLEQLNLLDARALAEQRRITIPLIKEVLDL